MRTDNDWMVALLGLAFLMALVLISFIFVTCGGGTIPTSSPHSPHSLQPMPTRTCYFIIKGVWYPYPC